MKNGLVTLGSWSVNFKKELGKIYPAREVQQIEYMVFEKYLGFSKTDLAIRREHNIGDKENEQIKNALMRLVKLEPVQHVINSAYFMGIVLKSDNRALIPRSETEELVAWVIEDHKGKEPRVADVGTGSGCIPIVLARELIGSRITAIDVSEQALQLAKENAQTHGVSIEFMEVDIMSWKTNPILSSCSQSLDVVISNPPYIQELDKKTMNRNVLDYEPDIALFVDNDDPLIFYKAIAGWSSRSLVKGGSLYLEINERFGNEITTLLNERGFEDIELRKDIHGKDRMVACKWQP
jgi:release factor glutamine methyltransferase